MDEPIKEIKKPYEPRKGSAGYSILVSLAFENEKGNNEGLNKDDLCKVANVWAKVSIESNSNGTTKFDVRAIKDRQNFSQQYCGWNIVKTLIKKHGLLQRFKKGIPKFFLIYHCSQLIITCK